MRESGSLSNWNPDYVETVQMESVALVPRCITASKLSAGRFDQVIKGR